MIPKQSRVGRRAYLGVGSAVATSALAGCLGDDDEDDSDDVDDTDVVDDGDDTDDIDDTADGDDTDDVDDTDDAPAVDRHDVAPSLILGPPVPGDVQYNSWAYDAEPTPAMMDQSRTDHFMMGLGVPDAEPWGQMVEEWHYQPGLIEITLGDGFYWWSGDPVTADDVLSSHELMNWMDGGDDLDAIPSVITLERLDEQSVRIALADTWREDWAIAQTLTGPLQFISSSEAWNREWIESFEDTGGDMDAVEDVRAELAEHSITSGTNENELVHHFNIPFEFRLDGELGSFGEDFWEFELVPEKHGESRRFADDINYERWRVYAVEEREVHEEEAFLAEETPKTVDHWEIMDDADFPIDTYHWRDDVDRWAYHFNCEIHPTDNPHFRRAWMFLVPRTLWEEPIYEPQQYVVPFVSDERTETWVSDGMLEQLEEYSMDEFDEVAAEAELERGGFERNGDGAWLNQDDGEPVAITVDSWPWLDFIPDTGSDFYSDINDFGLNVDHVPEYGAADPWRVRAAYNGGLVPEEVFESAFGETTVSWAGPNPNLPESVRAPPVGEHGVDSEEWEEFETRTLVDQLGLMTDEDQFQDTIDQLTWVANQIVPRGAVVAHQRTGAVNANRWSVEDPGPRTRWFRQLIWHDGTMAYVPEDER